MPAAQALAVAISVHRGRGHLVRGPARGWPGRSTVVAAAMVLSRAVPMEAPICWDVLVMAEVTPTSLGFGVLGGRADARHDGEPQARGPGGSRWAARGSRRRPPG